MKTKHFFLIFLVLLCFKTNIIHAQNVQKLRVAAAANIQFVIEQLISVFEKGHNIKIELVTGATGKLEAQILEGAPFDVFVSADMATPEDLEKKGFSACKTKQYAIGELVLWTNVANIEPNPDLNLLSAQNIHKIAVANPKTAPYGKAAEEALKYFRMYEKIKDKLVIGENVGQANQYIATGAAEIGFTAKSLVVSGPMKGKGKWVEIDKKAYTPLKQGALILKHGKETNLNTSVAFFNFLYSKEAKKIFMENGYLIN